MVVTTSRLMHGLSEKTSDMAAANGNNGAMMPLP